jgi:DNA-binding response OmpR family regulator
MPNNWIASPGSPRILIVDDEPAICSALTQVLRRAGFDPIAAHGPPEAEELLSESIAAMLLDLRMAHMRGDSFYFLAAARCPQLRKRTLFITGDISPDGERLINQTGCGVLWKPFPNAVLVDAVRDLLADRTEAYAAARY